MSLISAAALITSVSASAIFEMGMTLARAAGLAVDSFRAGDPTLVSYKYLAQKLATSDSVIAEYTKASWLSLAEADWLTVLAWEVYGVPRGEANFATPKVTLSNTTGYFYDLGEGELRVRNSATGKTYRSSEAFVIAGGSTVTVQLEADEEGSESSVGANEIDEFVAPAMLGVEITSSTPSAARDAQSDDSLREQCRSTTGALSPNGPPDAYEYVARNADLTGTLEVTRAKAIEDGTDLAVTLYLAGPSGSVSSGAVDLVQAALERWATPLCVTPTAVSATPFSQAVTYEVSNSPDLVAGWEDLVAAKVEALLNELPIGDFIARSALIAAIHSASPSIKRVELVVPVADVDLDPEQVAVPGVITGTEV